MRAEIVARLRTLPKIDAVLARSDVRDLAGPRWALVEAVRREVERARQQILAGQSVDVDANGQVALSVRSIETRMHELTAPSIRTVINATGVVLHTNLGRAPIAREVLEHATRRSIGYCNLEYDVSAGRRGSRHNHVSGSLMQLTGAEDAVVVNNCAGAVMLCLAALAAGREAVVSRGELVEIGGSFRIPDVMRMSGVDLIEVGTTNKTRIADYEHAISERTALLLKVHRSNFAVVGFTEEASLDELATLGRASGTLTMMDLGSGLLLHSSQLAAFGLAPEPSVAEVVASGIDVVVFSGDKLLGGPQAGIIVGRSTSIATIREHPMMRALRTDKLVLAALEATLALYRDGRAVDAIPTWSMLSVRSDELEATARALLERIEMPAKCDVEVTVTACTSTVGGGTMPCSSLPSFGLALRSTDRDAHELESRLRARPVPVVARVVDDRVVLDLRTVAGEHIDELVEAIQTLTGA